MLVQGLATAAFSQLTIRFLEQIIGKNFNNVAQFEAKPAYLRQLRAVGVGMVAAAGTDLLLQDLQAETPGDPDQSSPDEESCATRYRWGVANRLHRPAKPRIVGRAREDPHTTSEQWLPDVPES
jgi:hypothetical protein